MVRMASNETCAKKAEFTDPSLRHLVMKYTPRIFLKVMCWKIKSMDMLKVKRQMVQLMVKKKDQMQNLFGRNSVAPAEYTTTSSG